MQRRDVEGVGGRLVKLAGDGSLSTFDGPARAIRRAERIRGRPYIGDIFQSWHISRNGVGQGHGCRAEAQAEDCRSGVR
jgi:hypothetical protein